MATGLIDIMKKASLSAMENESLCDLRFGVVASTSPLSVKVSDMMTLPAELLIVPQHLTRYSVSVTLSGSTGGTSPTVEEGGTAPSEEDLPPHTHSLSGSRTMTINNALKKGDKVALLRKSGGTEFFILDRI